VSTGTRWGAHGAPKHSSWIGESRHRGVQEEGKTKRGLRHKRGISEKEGGTEGEGGSGRGKEAQEGSEGYTYSLRPRQSEIMDGPGSVISQRPCHYKY